MAPRGAADAAPEVKPGSIAAVTEEEEEEHDIYYSFGGNVRA